MTRGHVLLATIILATASSLQAADSVKVGGRIMYDLAAYDSDDAEFSSGGELRRARLFAKGKLDDDWSYKLQYDFTGSGSEGIRDAWLGYTALPMLDSIRFGHFVEYGSLEDTTSSKHMTFMERSLPVLAFSPATRRLGVGVDAHGSGWYGGAGLFGENAAADTTGSEGVGGSARLVWMPVQEDRHTVHLGVHGAIRTPDDSETAQFRARPEAHVDGTRLVDTGIISNVNDRATFGLEAAWSVGPVSLDGEHIVTTVSREGFDDERYSGSYVAATWFVTGETRSYDAEGGCFGRIKPAHPLGEDGWGALALAARASWLDLDDGIAGGTQEDITLALNWYPTSRVRFMLNYVAADADKAGEETRVDIVQLRTQVDF